MNRNQCVVAKTCRKQGPLKILFCQIFISQSFLAGPEGVSSLTGIFPPSLPHSLTNSLTHFLRQINANLYVKFNNLCSPGRIFMKLSGNDLGDITNNSHHSTWLYSTLLDSTRLYSTLLDSTRLNSTQLDSLNSTRLNSTQLYSTRIDLNRLDSTQLDWTRLNLTQLDLTRLNSTRLNSTQLFSTLL